jgi:hypothetical protein
MVVTEIDRPIGYLMTSAIENEASTLPMQKVAILCSFHAALIPIVSKQTMLVPL